MDDFDTVFDSEFLKQGSFLPASGIIEFNAQAYLLAYPDVQLAIVAGQSESAIDHYIRYGRGQRRLESAEYLTCLAGGCDERPSHGQLSFNVEAALLSDSDMTLVVGWTDDQSSALLSISAIRDDEGWNSRAIARCRRPDAEQALGAGGVHPFGFWMLDHAAVEPAGRADQAKPIMLRARMLDGRFTQTEVTPRLVSDAELRETALSHFAGLEYLGNRDIEAFRQLDIGAGAAIIALNRRIVSAITKAAHVERFGPQRERFAASFIICLFGKPEYFFLQNALFATGRSAADIEFVYVSNSPELAEVLHKEAHIAERIYGLSVTLVTLSDNAGFSAANNAAARVARSDRLVFINPDVFPRDDAWAEQHAAVLETQPQRATALFGAPLYYDDGSLMHGGMYFEIDRGLSVRPGGIEAKPLIRVEHYGKGAPAHSDKYSGARPVPAVTGAFISADRAWFERLGGFTEDYVFGHYEDADLCLKSLQSGVPAWLQDIRFWHLEGKGSVRRPVHEGGSLVNRWHFTRIWGDLIEGSLLGRAPSHPLLTRTDDPVPPSIDTDREQDAPIRVEAHGLRAIASRLSKRSRGVSGGRR